MKSRHTRLLLLFSLAFFVASCSKSNSVSSSSELYPVTATVLDPGGNPQSGAILKLQGKDDNDPVFATVTDSAGNGTIKAPSGNQTLVAKIGSIFQVSFNVNVQASQTPTIAGSHHLAQNTALKVLVIYGDAENIENVLRDPSIGFTAFDTTDVYSLRSRVATDSTGTLNYLKQYTLIFSDCNGGDEDGYPLLARTYGRYVAQGGKIFGGHYNYYNLQYIFPGYYENVESISGDSLTIVDDSLSKNIGYKVVAWSNSGNTLDYYDQFRDLPPSAKVYVIITGTQPPIPVVVENDLQSGKYLFTIYHNQDILNYTGGADPKLVKIIKYFLYSL